MTLAVFRNTLEFDPLRRAVDEGRLSFDVALNLGRASLAVTRRASLSHSLSDRHFCVAGDTATERACAHDRLSGQL